MPGAALSLALAGALLAPLVDGNQFGDGWRVVGLPKQAPPMTRFTPDIVQGRAAVRVAADKSYGNLLHRLPAVPAPRALRWSWRLLEPAARSDLHSKAGDDVAAKVCLSFDLPLAQVPFMDRQRLRMARDLSGEDLPSATLCWVWATTETVGAKIDNAFSRRVRYIVLRNAADAPGAWVDEQRDVAADFLRAFGDETTTVPPLTGVAVGADADNTGGRSLAHITALRFEP
jgi:hypothetical protein